MKSIWKKEEKSFGKVFAGNIKTDVAIIGGGMAGILTAYLLKENNIKSIVIEQNKVASGQTGLTTAKITIQHSVIYSELIKKFGLETAQKYAEANFAALKNYERIIGDNNIKCHYEKRPSYLYTTRNPQKILSEASAAEKLKIPSKITTKTTLPFSTKLALCFYNQAQFNPMEFIDEISKHLVIHEDTKVLSLNKNEVHTNKGVIKAKHIVFACHIPFVNFPGLYFARMHRERSYVTALKNAAKLDGIYYGIDSDGLSFRNYEDLLLLGGSGHRTGQNNGGKNYTKLRSAAKQFFPYSTEVAHWSAQDCITHDRIPYIGKFSSLYPNRYVATGFCKWGMTSSMAAAQIISDCIAGKENEYSDIFSPSRFNMSCAGGLCHEFGKTVKGLAGTAFYIPDKSIRSIKNGDAQIVTYKGKKCGVYKDINGRCYVVSVKCPHLGCQLEWNPDDKSWDCPCHGSRFDYKGNLIDSPAQKGIALGVDLNL